MSESDEVIISRLRLSSPKDVPTDSTSIAKRKLASRQKNNAGWTKLESEKKKSGAKKRNKPAKPSNNKKRKPSLKSIMRIL